MTDRLEHPIDPYPPGAGFSEYAATPPPAGPLRPRRRRAPIGRWVTAVIAVLALVGVLLAAPWDPERRQAYADQWVVWTEPPPAEIEKLADDLALTETGRRIFFASRPQIDSAQSFQEHCPAESQVVLGCYHLERIYVYGVTDERLAGTVETTAAHELLHAFYDRLNRDDRGRIDAIVAAHVAGLAETDPNILIVAGYAERQRADEWHARLATSYADLPPELELHYARIFADRSKVLAFDSRSTAELESYASRISELGAQLDAAFADLETRSADYDSSITKLNADIDAFNRRADSGSFSSQSQFDSERAALLARQGALEQKRVALNVDVEAYNVMLEELRSLDAQRAQLYAALDSRSAP